ncbi:MAG TPA: hypothetical protein VMV78_02865 [Thiobacillus sp.]|nr:hypothetical protein [Thiobacillus sp.]
MTVPLQATRRLFSVLLRLLAACRSETDFIAFLDSLKTCADDAVTTLLVPCGTQSTLFKWSQQLTSLTCELTIVYFPW